MSLNIVVNADVAAAGREIQDFSKQSRIALTNLSLVAQDLPFGFIGIQNNLPGVIQSFGALRAESGGTINAFKQLGSALIGPAGLFFAFSAVTSAITFAVREYGSLGEAFRALIGLAPTLTEQQKTFNEETAKSAGNVVVEESKIKILTKTLTDLSKPLKDRVAAYDELKKVSPDVVAGIDKENISSQSSIDIINKQTEARLKLLRLKIQESGITAVLTKNAEELAIKQQELNLADQEYVRNTAAYNAAINNKTVFGKALVDLQNNASDAFLNSVEKVQSLRKEIISLTGTQEDYFKQLEPVVNSTAEINSQTQTLIENLKRQKQAQKDLNTDVESGGQLYSKYVGDEEVLSKVRLANIKLTTLSVQKQADEIRKLNLQNNIIPKGVTVQAPTGLGNLADEIAKFGELQRIEDQILKTRNVLEEGFFRPLQRSFTDFLTSGKFTFKEFGKTVLDAIARITARLAATGLSKLLANLLAPGIGGAIAGAQVGAATQGGSVFSNLFSGLFGGVAAPSFGGVNGGGMEMGGQVNLLLRGSDLVGAINRTNAQISRTG